MGLYQVVLGSNMIHFFIYFEIDVKDFQNSNENNIVEASEKEENFLDNGFLKILQNLEIYKAKR